jgi:hypothetical protein
MIHSLTLQQQCTFNTFLLDHFMSMIDNKICKTHGSLFWFSIRCTEGEPVHTSESDLALLMLGLIGLAAITKLGSAKVSCQQFSSMIPDIIGRFMDMLLEFVPLSKSYNLTKDIGLQREFLHNFGPRAAHPKLANGNGVEISFWIDLVQKQLLRALDREKIWSRLTTSESIEVGT